MDSAFDLVAIRAWLDCTLMDYCRHVRRADRGVAHDIERMLASLSGQMSGMDAAEAVRLLSAVGLAQCIRLGIRFDRNLPDRGLLQIGVLTMWPLVVTPRLPAQWREAHAQIVSPRFTAIVAGSRDARSAGKVVTLGSLANFIARKPHADAVVNLLDDLADPRRGGRVLAALGVAMRRPVPPRSGRKAALTWVVSETRMSGADLAEEAATFAVEEAVDAIWGRATGSGASGSGSLGTADGFGVGSGGRHGTETAGVGKGDADASDGLADVIADLFR